MTSHIPHDQNGVPESSSYGDAPASYTMPEDTTDLGSFPFGMRFTPPKAAGEKNNPGTGAPTCM